MSDPFTDFMTGQLSKRHAAEDRRGFRLIYFTLTALIVLAVVKLVT
jgi:hypothetical protein